MIKWGVVWVVGLFFGWFFLLDSRVVVVVVVVVQYGKSSLYASLSYKNVPAATAKRRVCALVSP